MLEDPPPPGATNCPNCARMLGDVCRLSFQLGKVHGAHLLLRDAARALVEWADTAEPRPGQGWRLDAIREALAVIDQYEPPPRP
jgi:hypothetical protein